MIKKKCLIAAAFSLVASPLIAAANAVPVGALDSFLGTAPDAISNTGLILPVIPAPGIKSSAYKNDFTVQTGDVLSFKFSFLTDEVDLIATLDEADDHAFIIIGGAPSSLNNVHGTDPFFPSSTSSIDATNTLTFSQALTTSGNPKFGLGIVDQDDASVTSGLLMDGNILTHNSSVIFHEGFEGVLSGSLIGDSAIVNARIGNKKPGGEHPLLLTTAPDSETVPAAMWLIGFGLIGITGLARRRAHR